MNKKNLKYLVFLPILFFVLSGCGYTEEEYTNIMRSHPERVGETVEHAGESVMDMYLVLPDSYRKENAKIFKDNMKIYVKEIKDLQGSEPDGYEHFHELYLKSMVNFQEAIDLYYDAVKKDSMSVAEFEEIDNYFYHGRQFMGMALDELIYIE